MGVSITANEAGEAEMNQLTPLNWSDLTVSALHSH